MTTGAQRLRRAVPWLVAAALLVGVFWRVDVEATRAAFAAADWRRFVAVALPFAGIWLVIDAAALSRLVTRFHTPVAFRTMLGLRGASYLFLVFSYDAAQAALALALHRRHAIPLLTLGGSFLLYYALDVLTIAGLGSLGAGALPGAAGAGLRGVLGLLFVGLAVALAGLARVARLPKARRPAWLGAPRLLETLRRVRLADAAELVGWRLLFYASFVAFAAATLPAFGIHVPLAALVACVPVTLSIVALPITVSGIGSAQVAMLALYGPFAEPAEILAYSLAHTASLIVLRLPIGLACWPAVAGTAVASPELSIRSRT